MNVFLRKTAGFALFLGLVLLTLGRAAGGAPPAARDEVQFVDLSLLVAPEYPCTWPQLFPPFHMNHYLQIGPRSAYNSDILTLDENTGTQLDAPAHGPLTNQTALITPDRLSPWQFVGEACVIDVRRLLDDSPNGNSPLILKEHILAWEKEHRPLGPGDVVLLRSGYADMYYVPLPAGRRFVADPVDGRSPAWPAPAPEAMDYVGSRGVRTAAIDSPSMGPLRPHPGLLGPNLAAQTHTAGLKYEMNWAEGVIGLGNIPATGSFYAHLPPKHRGGIGGEIRAFAIVGDPLAQWLIDAARRKRVVDLSVQLGEELPVWWPGPGAGNSRYPYYQHVLPLALNPPQHQRAFDSHTGTHLVPPVYALPEAGFDNHSYAPEVQQWLADYEREYGRRGTSNMTTEQVPLSQTGGWARIIDVKHLIGTTTQSSWPASPVIAPEDIKKYEERNGDLEPGSIVIFHSGYSDTYLRPFPQDRACLVDPLNGEREGWPAPGPETIDYLAKKGIRCVATDGPTLGGVDPRRALMTYWALGSRGMVGVEYLTNLGAVPPKAYFIFAAARIRGSHGGPGRAIALY